MGRAGHCDRAPLADAQDGQALLTWSWAGLPGGEPRASLPGWYELEERGRPRINFQPVPEPKTVKTRIHLDLTVEDIDRAVGAVVQAGGRVTGERHDYAEGVVVVMADPEGNEFCLVKYFT